MAQGNTNSLGTRCGNRNSQRLRSRYTISSISGMISQVTRREVAIIPLPRRLSLLPPAIDWRSRVTQRATIPHPATTSHRTRAIKQSTTRRPGSGEGASTRASYLTDNRRKQRTDNLNRHSLCNGKHRAYGNKSAPQPTRQLQTLHEATQAEAAEQGSIANSPTCS